MIQKLVPNVSFNFSHQNLFENDKTSRSISGKRCPNLPVLLNLSMSFETLLLTGAEPGMLELGSIVEL
jgi:hypothetical protein